MRNENSMDAALAAIAAAKAAKEANENWCVVSAREDELDEAVRRLKVRIAMEAVRRVF